MLHMNRLLATGLARHIDEFCRESAQFGGILVLPRTVILENERHQQSLYVDAVAKLEAARLTLAQCGIAVPAFRPEDVLRRVDLSTALGDTGIKVEIENPTLNDYRDAERRASLHLAPQSPDANSDEMRDLVIWAVALRIAAGDGDAMLVSRDAIHSDEGGSAEANTVRLHRAKTFVDALEQLGRVSRAGALVRSVLATIWDELKASGIPLAGEVPSRRFLALQFSVDDDGHVNMRLNFEFATGQGKLSGDAHIYQLTPSSIQAAFMGLTIEREPWRTGTLNVMVNGQLPKPTGAVDERMTELRDVTEGNQ